MIGGTDIIIPVKDCESALETAVLTIARAWKSAFVEDAETGAAISKSRDPGLLGRQEILVYRNAAAQKSWKELGADESLDGTMIHLIARDGELTIAVDDIPSPAIRSLVDAIQKALHASPVRSAAG